MPTANEALRDATISHQVDLAQYSTHVVRRMIGVLNRADAELSAALQGALARMDGEAFTVERLELVLSSVRAVNLAAYRAVERELTEELARFAEVEAGVQADMLRAAVPEPVAAVVSFVRVEPAQVYAAAMSRPFQGRLLREWAQHIEERRMWRIRETIRSGFTTGKTIDQMVREVRGTRAAQYSDGIMNASREEARSVVRTAIQHLAANVRDATHAENADIIKAIKWSATLDGRTSDTCFPGGALALPVGDLRGVIRRHWNGYLVVVTTASGKKLRATPNHPVLTARGWRPIQEVKPGKDVLHVLTGDVGPVEPSENVEVPPTIGAIFDALNKPAFGDVLSESSSEIDFHGDGMRGDYEVNYPRSKRDLRLALEASFGKKLSEQLLAFVGSSRGFATESHADSILFGERFRDVTAKIRSIAIQDGVEAGLADLEDSANVSRSCPVDEHLDHPGLIRPLAELPSAQGGHDSGALEDSCGCGCGDTVALGDRRSGLSVGVATDDVVSVEREFFSGHVYNLSTSTEFYIADGFVVHNCRIRDGKQYRNTERHEPIGHKIPWGGGPGKLHWNCRSSGVAVLKSLAELSGLDIGEDWPQSTRASMDGQVPADLSYGDWLKKQSAERQDEVVGPTRGKLMREGKLPFDALYTDRGAALTLEQLRARHPGAFRRAGV